MSGCAWLLQTSLPSQAHTGTCRESDEWPSGWARGQELRRCRRGRGKKGARKAVRRCLLESRWVSERWKC